MLRKQGPYGIRVASRGGAVAELGQNPPDSCPSALLILARGQRELRSLTLSGLGACQVFVVVNKK